MTGSRQERSSTRKYLNKYRIKWNPSFCLWLKEGFSAKTTLAVVHTHYFLLGMVFFLLLVLLEKSFSFTGPKTGRVLDVYHIGLNLTVVMFVVRGIVQVLGTALSAGMDAAISGIAGIGHILLGISMGLLLMQIRRSVAGKDELK